MDARRKYRPRLMSPWAKEALAVFGLVLSLVILNWALPLILEAMAR